MTVSELIAELQKFDPDMDVIISQYYIGETTEIVSVKIEYGCVFIGDHILPNKQ